MSDESRRARERELLKNGSPEDIRAYNAQENRTLGFHNRSYFRHCDIGEHIAFASGPNYMDCGILVEVWEDELGRACAAFDRVKRMSNEDDDGPTWMGDIGSTLCVASTTLTHLQPAKARWGDKFKPW